MVRKGHLRAQQEGALCKPEREPSLVAEPTNILILAVFSRTKKYMLLLFKTLCLCYFIMDTEEEKCISLFVFIPFYIPLLLQEWENPWKLLISLCPLTSHAQLGGIHLLILQVIWHLLVFQDLYLNCSLILSPVNALWTLIISDSVPLHFCVVERGGPFVCPGRPASLHPKSSHRNCIP